MVMRPCVQRLRNEPISYKFPGAMPPDLHCWHASCTYILQQCVYAIQGLAVRSTENCFLWAYYVNIVHLPPQSQYPSYVHGLLGAKLLDWYIEKDDKNFNFCSVFLADFNFCLSLTLQNVIHRRNTLIIKLQVECKPEKFCLENLPLGFFPN